MDDSAIIVEKLQDGKQLAGNPAHDWGGNPRWLPLCGVVPKTSTLKRHHQTFMIPVRSIMLEMVKKLGNVLASWMI